MLFATNLKLWFCFCQILFYLEHLRFGPAGGNSKGDVDHWPIAHRPDCHTFSWRVRPPSGWQGSAAARWRPGWRDVCRWRWYRHTAGWPFRPGCWRRGRHSGWRAGAEWVLWGRGVERRSGAAMTELVTLLPLVQLPDGVGPWASLLRGEAEVAEPVLGVLVLAKSAGWGALTRSSWQGLICIHRCELVLRWWCATREGVLSGRRAIGCEHKRMFLPQEDTWYLYKIHLILPKLSLNDWIRKQITPYYYISCAINVLPVCLRFMLDKKLSIFQFQFSIKSLISKVQDLQFW